MTKVTLAGLTADKEGALEGLQALGKVHLTPLRAAGPLEPPDAARRRRAVAAFRWLGDAPAPRRPWPANRETDLDRLIDDALANKERLRTLSDRRDFLARRIADLEPWGEFRFPPPEAVAYRKLWFYILPRKERRALERLDLPWAVVARDATRLFVALIAEDEPPADVLPVPRTHTGAVPLSALQRECEDLDIEIEEAQAARAALGRWRLVLGVHLAAAEDGDDRRAAAQMTRDDPEAFALQGWAPVEAAPALRTFAQARGLALILEDPAPEDSPPTLLHEPERFGAAADLTAFYMTPAYRSWDPSLIVFAAFAAFFAMILSDAGYAALIGLGAALWWRRLGRSRTGARLRLLLAALAGAALLYGVAAGSYFGVAPPEGSPLALLRVIDVNDFETMMRVSIVIGALHLAVAFGVTAWLGRGTGKATAALGWIGAIAGGLTLWLAPEAGPFGYGALGLGLLAVFCGAGADRPVSGAMEALRRLGDGALALTGVTRLFGDVLSYMRLFALGLSSASLAATFNGLAGDVAAHVPGAGVALAGLVLLFGHAINLALGIMSGVVHGLRLNFIEFFGWGLTEEGYPFRAFERREANT
jgi:V/A-type H+-transporting ATPase subunit I